MENLSDLLTDQLKDIYNAEHQLLKALPRMAKRATTPDLKSAFENHTVETEKQIERLETIGKTLDIKLSGKKCKAMEGLIEEGKEVLKEKGHDLIIDSALIAAAQRVEHYEISAYGTARALAEALGEEEVVSLLEETLQEEEAADEKLSDISENSILEEAPRGNEGEEQEGEVEE